ncbi:oligosaccharide flippase family protein [Streptococcus catagoni]|uniref:oligosaccharide flippase family protein n=1 Tax=Streptococcus catagoni TaxID=2654874 RepID=UPI00140BA633|nr:oligosaccharide flippase family protein [Streptococcus catagoni]
MKNKILQNAFYLYLFTIVKMIVPLATLPYLTRVLSVENYGLVAYVKAYASYVLLFLDFGFLLYSTKRISKLDINNSFEMNEISKIIGDTFIEKILLAFLIVLLSAIIIPIIPILDSNKLFTILFIISCLITVFLPDFFYQGIEDMKYIVIPFSIAKAVTVCLTLFLVKSDNNILFIPIFEMIGNILSVIISLLFLKKFIISVQISNIHRWLDDLKRSSIYFISNFATTFFGALTTIIVGVNLDKTDIAFWSLAMQVVSIIKAMYTPITNSIYPFMVREKSISLLNKVRNRITLPIIFGIIIIFIFGEKIFIILGGNNYSSSAKILEYLTPVIFFSFYSMLYGWPALGVIGKVKATTISTILAAIVQIIGVFILIITDKFNLVSLAINCSLSEFLLFIIRYYVFIDYYRKNGGIK